MRIMQRQNDRVHRGVMLLEVIVALGILVFGLAMVGLQINSGLQVAQKNRLYTQAAMLVDSKLDEVEAGVVQPDLIEQEVKGDFGILYPGYTWRVEIHPTEIEDFYMAEIQIGYRQGAVEEQIRDPKSVIDIEDQDTKILRTAYRLFPKPADINLERDYGITQEDMDAMLADLGGLDTGGGGTGGGGTGGGITGGGGRPGGGGMANAGGGPGAGGPVAGGGRSRGFVRPGAGGGPGGGGGGAGGDLPDGLPPGMDREAMLALLQSLLQMSDSGSFDPRMLQQLPEEEFMALAEILESLGMGRGNMSNLKDMYKGQAGGPPPMSRRGQGRRGFGRADGRAEPGGQETGGQPGASGGSNVGRGPGGNRPPNAGNREPGSGGQQNPRGRTGGRTRDGSNPGGGSSGRTSGSSQTPRNN